MNRVQRQPATPTGALTADREAPQANDAERAVLSACIRSQEALGEATEVLVAEDFFSARHQAIFAALQNLSERGEPPDLVTLAVELENQGLLESVGGPAVLDELLDVASSPANVIYHARIVAERARLRAIIGVSNQTARQAYEGTTSSDDLLDGAQNELFQLAQKSERRSYEPLKSLATVTFQRIQEAYNRGDEMTGVPTGFLDLDKMTGGLQPSDLVILAGRPSMGKTAIALNIAYNAARHATRPAPVGVFSLEMSSEQLVMRLISAQGRLDNHAVRTGRLKHTDWPRLTHCLSELTNTPLYIDDTSGISLLELRSKARRMVQLHGVKMIIVDYLQLITVGGRSESRQQEISLISRSLKGMAKDLHVPVVALSQLSRAVEARGEHRPVLSDLRESGAIEQDADVVMFVYRESVYDQENPEIANLAEVIIGKQRNGPIGSVKLHFDSRYTLFSNLAQREPPPGAGQRRGRGPGGPGGGHGGDPDLRVVPPPDEPF